MSAFSIVRHTPLTPEQAWAAVSDFRAHGEVFPATVMDLDDDAPRIGWQFAAGTGLGKARLWDRMIITKWQPPGPADARGELRMVKIGRWLRGWAHVVVEADGQGARVTWTEELGPRPDPLPRLTAPVSKWIGERLFARAVDQLLARPNARG